MRGKKVWLGAVSLILMFTLAACSANNGWAGSQESTGSNRMDGHSDSSMAMGMHSGSSNLPKGLKSAKHPTFRVGSKAIIDASHMAGMDGAEATIVGAYATVVYSVSYTPTTGGKRVMNHKWVIQEEIKNAGDQPLEPGDTVTLLADHMKGMKRAKVVVDTAKKATVYMVDYTSTNGGGKVTNHKWVTEDELSSH
ncbi:YdhK family protein [Sporolactobacillus terrae]|uniref:DUF1541 domain-containing protein n=1 Tax=Sporolactobacillus terrae TaxID=269673 RepID=A0A410D5K5_9BACL|nr:YdhK family protein [Sporolactobacillus terrae]QAA21373.1 hypothetical protein C0674_01290 [Sporolactobacillus terrae]QAA24345.1 hypothetical protein C0679_01270 [Sporolactobacillus terrae]UAK16166.1 YdhK family protein [Sporolactobacillus terrae]BBN97621.1 hypothetical protein St703_03260 [Sporolactobacillus terrae]